MVCFNDENVVRAIANCSIPVIAGIGHQRDESLADLAADVFAHTPTAAAEQAVPCLADLYQIHLDRVQALNLAVAHYLSFEHDRLGSLRDRLSRLKLDRALKQEAQVVSWLRQRLIQSTQQRFQTATQHCQMLQEKLTTLDPQAVLQRGYAVVRAESGIVRSTSNITVGENLTIQLGQGQIGVTVTDVSNPSGKTGDKTL
jgi:exodeoxyribonuclease VII large subunit